MAEQTRTYDLWLVTPPGHDGWLVDGETAVTYYRSRGYGIQEVELTLYVGDHVYVRAFGGLRRGRVVKLNRRRVAVRFERNRRGDIAERLFSAAEIVGIKPNPRRG